MSIVLILRYITYDLVLYPDTIIIIFTFGLFSRNQCMHDVIIRKYALLMYDVTSIGKSL